MPLVLIGGEANLVCSRHSLLAGELRCSGGCGDTCWPACSEMCKSKRLDVRKIEEGYEEFSASSGVE